MRVKIEVTMDNAAFESDPGIELGRILRQAVRMMENEGVQACANSSLYDINGNKVGYVKVLK